MVNGENKKEKKIVKMNSDEELQEETDGENGE